MVGVYELRPRIEHYGCVIDLLGRAGLLEEAYGVIKGLPVERDASAWRALLGACRVYADVELAERVKGKLEEIGEECSSDSIAVYGAYAVAGMLPYCGDVLERRVKEMDRGKKEAGCSTLSWI
ncbi:pentatricopeptide repeat-containing protein at1g26900 mitochondrial [Phtheirospermum japonicum]|uniref:Pentatricopeptide repeat-containing protein at1g26900 mitochondrial n=1 Tax=Phtheirospermum japonicum TaxID=374723 RepID=A0A830C7I2_9LAMI|nr:pentatricopeptide repeat-containing protein at1g26900 mitochondrial [Phtheirospermum japonicum]